jgi:hypothetical protein
MAVEGGNISVDPYKSTVPLAPLVQMPQQDLQAQQAPAIYSKTGGIAQFADTAMKGLLKGLQIKQETKFKAAEATMATQDAAIADAKKRYNDALMMYGKDDERTKAAWGEYGGTVNKAADMYEAFAIPKKETGTKSQKKAQGAKDKAAGIPVQGGFIDHLKHIASQNPELIPQIAIAGMLSQVDPKTYGQMAPEQIKAKQDFDASQRLDANQKVTDAATATRNKYAGKKDLTAAQQQEYDNAVAVLTPIAKPSAKTRVINEIGKPDIQHVIRDDEDIPPGYELHERPLASQTARVGTEQEFTGQALKAYGYDKDTAPSALLKYLHDSWAYKAAQTTSGTSERMETDPKTGELVAVKTGSSTTRGAAAPKPPAGFAPLGENGLPQEAAKPAASAPAAATSKTGKMSKPPAAPGAGKGTMTAAPLPPGVRDTGLRAMPGAQNTERVETQEKNMYATATKNYEAALKTNKAKAPDKASLDAANAQAQTAYDAEKAQIVLWKAKQVKAVGGDPWRAQAKGADGKIYATMDGTNWVNVETGYPYTEQ